MKNILTILTAANHAQNAPQPKCTGAATVNVMYLKSAVQFRVIIQSSFPFLGAFAYCRKKSVLIPSCPSARPPIRMHKLGSHWTDFGEISYYRLLQKLSRISKFVFNREKMPATLHEDLITFVYLPTVRNIF
jgi:hypothetical protein